MELLNIRFHFLWRSAHAKDRSFEKDYVEGRYGTIPYIGNVQNVVTEWQEN
jgi:hypothetical protein